MYIYNVHECMCTFNKKIIFNLVITVDGISDIVIMV
jgi:hypothetical protein